MPSKLDFFVGLDISIVVSLSAELLITDSELRMDEWTDGRTDFTTIYFSGVRHH